MFWTLIIIGVLGLLGWVVAKIYQVIVMRKVKDFKDAHGTSMKGTKPTFLVGDVLSEYLFPTSLTSKDFLRYGDVYYRWFFWKPTLMLVDHEGIQRVLNDSDSFRKNTPIYQNYSEGNDITDQSEAIKEVFSHKHMETLGDSVLGMAEGFCDQLVDSQGNGVVFNVYNTSLFYTREVLGTVLYGDTFSARQIMTAQRELSSISPMRVFIRRIFPALAKMAPSYFGIEQATELSAGLTKSISSPAPHTILAFLEKHHKNKNRKSKKGAMGDQEERKIEHDKKTFDKHRGIHMQDEVKAMHKRNLDSDDSEDERDYNIRLKQSISNIIGFYTTGLNTTASVLTSTLYMLMRYPDIQAQLRDEIIKKLNGEALTYAKLKEMRFLTHFIKETLRLHPPYPILYPRVSRRSEKLVGFHIPKQTNIIIDVVGHNRHPKYWSNPDSFDPTRFAKNPGATKYVLVWGSGPQEKVGRALGLLVLRCTIATMLLKYQLVCGATSSSRQIQKIKFERSVGSLRPTPDLDARVTEIST